MSVDGANTYPILLLCQSFGPITELGANDF